MDLEKEELSEEELSNIMGGANKEALKEAIERNPNVYRQNRIAEIEGEIEKLRQQKEELLKNSKTL